MALLEDSIARLDLMQLGLTHLEKIELPSMKQSQKVHTHWVEGKIEALDSGYTEMLTTSIPNLFGLYKSTGSNECRTDVYRNVPPTYPGGSEKLDLVCSFKKKLSLIM